jgi:hypothetical protein
MSTTKAKNAAKAALVAAALGIAAGSVQAEDAPYVFTAIDTTRHGADVVNGHYDDAIMRIRGKSDTETDFSESTNLCIAYTKSGDAANGIANCNRAVDIARRKNGMRRIGGVYATFSGHGKDLDLVIALSNRSVAHATNGDYAMAFEDLQEANALRPYLRAVPRNLEALAESMNAAQ